MQKKSLMLTAVMALAAPTAQAQTAQALPHALSPWGMFLSADIVVQSVMLALAAASVATWTVLLAKTLELWTTRRKLRAAITVLAEGEGLAEVAVRLGADKGAAGALVRAAVAEVRLSVGLPGEGLKERVASRLERIEAASGRRMAVGTGVLATIGATGPFVGLFGTVWGIMNSFIGISKAATTSLAVVAPGIAEALLATAIGLVAAIPAVIVYNVFARAITGIKAEIGDAAAAVLRLVSRDYDRRALSSWKAAE